ANGLSMSSIIYPGQKLKLSGSAGSSSVASQKSSTTGASTPSTSGSYKVRSGDTLSGIAAQHKISLSTLLSANGLSRTSIIYPGQQLKLSGTSSKTSSSTKSSSSSARTPSQTTTHTVKAGDTLSGIAARHGVSLATILQANGLSLTSTIFPGQKIALAGKTTQTKPSSSGSKSTSGSANVTYTVKAGDTLSGIASRNGVSLSTILRANGLSASSIIYPGQKIALSGSKTSTGSTTTGSSSTAGSSTTTSSTYTVKSGNTLSEIASRNGISLQTLLQANGLSRTSIIYPGQSLKLNGSATGGSSSIGTASTGGSTEQLIGNTFLHYTYPDHVVANANANKRALLNSPM